MWRSCRQRCSWLSGQHAAAGLRARACCVFRIVVVLVRQLVAVGIVTVVAPSTCVMAGGQVCVPVGLLLLHGLRFSQVAVVCASRLMVVCSLQVCVSRSLLRTAGALSMVLAVMCREP